MLLFKNGLAKRSVQYSKTMQHDSNAQITRSSLNRCLACGTGKCRNYVVLAHKHHRSGDQDLQSGIIAPRTLCNQLVHKRLCLLSAQV
jgi:hypothetical protein